MKPHSATRIASSHCGPEAIVKTPEHATGRQQAALRTRTSACLTACRIAWLVFAFGNSHSTTVIASDDEPLSNDVTVLYDVRYREGAVKAWRLDLAMPKHRQGTSRPAIVVIHGGGWLEGDKSSFSTEANRPPGNIIDFARLGFVAVTINYRLSKVAPFPAALHDCQCAVRWLRANAEKYQIDPNRIGAWGNSAGGHLALMLALGDKKEALEKKGPYLEQSSAVQAVVSDSGPVDLLYQYEHDQIRTAIRQFLGGPPSGLRSNLYRRASPLHHVSRRAPPMMLIYGAADSQVGVETADRFVTALRQAGVKDLSYHRLGKVGHCPHSLVRVRWLVPAVNEFFLRTLQARP